jgi:hypothetical protein
LAGRQCTVPVTALVASRSNIRGLRNVLADSASARSIGSASHSVRHAAKLTASPPKAGSRQRADLSRGSPDEPQINKNNRAFYVFLQDKRDARQPPTN